MDQYIFENIKYVRSKNHLSMAMLNFHLSITYQLTKKAFLKKRVRSDNEVACRLLQNQFKLVRVRTYYFLINAFFIEFRIPYISPKKYYTYASKG